MRWPPLTDDILSFYFTSKYLWFHMAFSEKKKRETSPERKRRVKVPENLISAQNTAKLRFHSLSSTSVFWWFSLQRIPLLMQYVDYIANDNTKQVVKVWRRHEHLSSLCILIDDKNSPMLTIMLTVWWFLTIFKTFEIKTCEIWPLFCSSFRIFLPGNLSSDIFFSW